MYNLRESVEDVGWGKVLKILHNLRENVEDIGWLFLNAWKVGKHPKSWVDSSQWESWQISHVSINSGHVIS